MIQHEREEYMSEMTIRGYWWLPDSPDDFLPGELVGSQGEGFHLNLQGGWGNWNEPKKGDVIHGKDEDGEPITLLMCFCVHIRWSGPESASRSRHFVHFAVLGAHLKSERKLCVSKAIFGLHMLDLWDTGVCQRIEHPNNGRSLTVTYEVPEPRTVCNMAAGQIKLVVHGPSMSRSKPGAVVSIVFRHRIIVDADRPRPFFSTADAERLGDHSLMAVIHRMTLFLSLAGLAPSFPYAVRGFLPATDGTRQASKEVQIVGMFKVPKEVVEPDWQDLLFRWGDVAQDAAKHLEAWMTFCQDCPRPAQLYYDILERGLGYDHVRFQSLVQALEGLHRKRFASSTGGETELKVRIQQLYGKMPKLIRDWIADRPVHKRAFSDIVKLRHDLAHSINEVSLSGGRHYALCLLMECILVTHFLMEMKLNEELIFTRIRESREYRELPKRLKGRTCHMGVSKSEAEALSTIPLSEPHETTKNGMGSASPSNTDDTGNRGRT